MQSLAAARSVQFLRMLVNTRSLMPDKWQRVARKTQSGAPHVVRVC